MTATKNEGAKIWGGTYALIRSPLFEMHHLSIKPGHACSIHTHRFKHNAFFVLSGTLFIDTWVGHHAESTRLTAGSRAHYMVQPGVRHRFRTGPDECVALEMYYTEPLSEDIQRENEGGPL